MPRRHRLAKDPLQVFYRHRALPEASEIPCCGSDCEVHQEKRRGPDDTRLGEVEVVRYRCRACFRVDLLAGGKAYSLLRFRSAFAASTAER